MRFNSCSDFVPLNIFSTVTFLAIFFALQLRKLYWWCKKEVEEEKKHSKRIENLWCMHDGAFLSVVLFNLSIVTN